jgi:chromate reductase
MITVISGTNRPGAMTLAVARLVNAMLREAGEETHLLDLAEMPHEIFLPQAYEEKPRAFGPFQRAILDANGMVVVVPEYNGSFPGVLKYFIDMLQFPESLVEKPAALVGLSAGRWGGIRAVEQLKMVLQYRHVHLYGRACYLPHVGALLGEDGHLNDADVEGRLRTTVVGFAEFSRSLRAEAE